MENDKKFGTGVTMAEQKMTDFLPLTNDAAVAAIKFALNDDDGMQFLRLWNEGEFDVIRSEWPEAPDEVFSDADQFHKPLK
nr:hypothetical protein [Pseudomonas syringae pv. actinidiae]